MGIDFKNRTAATAPAAPAVKDEMVVQEYDIQADREQMTKTLVNSQEVDNLVSTIVIDDPDTIVNFGNEAAQEISRCSDVVLNSMNMSQINDSGEMLTLLANIMSKFDVNELVDGKQGVLSKLFSNAKKQLEQILSKYHTMGEEVDKIYVKLKQYESEIKQSNKSLEEMFQVNVRISFSLSKTEIRDKSSFRQD